jgi:uncharacterized protein YecT (DUF1311 family)
VVFILNSSFPARTRHDKGPGCRGTLTQTEMNQYAARDAKQADAERNRLWPQFVERARQADKRVDNGRPECKETLRETRRDWVEFRDLNNA